MFEMEQFLEDNRMVDSCESDTMDLNGCYCNCHNADNNVEVINNVALLHTDSEVACTSDSLTSLNLCDVDDRDYTVPSEPSKPAPVVPSIKIIGVVVDSKCVSSADGCFGFKSEVGNRCYYYQGAYKQEYKQVFTVGVSHKSIRRLYNNHPAHVVNNCKLVLVEQNEKLQWVYPDHSCESLNKIDCLLTSLPACDFNPYYVKVPSNQPPKVTRSDILTLMPGAGLDKYHSSKNFGLQGFRCEKVYENLK
ncbi:hypothetical protein [Photobacterium leiognathi]|uniref:hypothetical protein n=1 Tax=Photobacterium leiognathi TaxID=553611 RepID=UPI00298245B7|nr:hypothetical protein [Photobacterium leiognathi]